MLGAMQIFFKDNPLFRRRLPWRHRWGYFGSLLYFFFPLVRFLLWLAPLYYLLFHLHPILADVSILLGYMLPYGVALSLLRSSLLPGWPRFLWSGLQEWVVTLPLLVAMVDVFLPKRLGFQVTPKGIQSQARSFDWASGGLTVGAAAITLLAILKGLGEFFWFGIEKDAYF